MSDYFSDRLKTERKRLKITIETMAKNSSVSRSSYCAYEAGETKPSVDFLMALAQLGVDTQYLLTGVRSITGRHANDFQDYPEIGTALVLDVVLFIDSWLSRNGKVMPADKKVEMVKALCKFLVTEERQRQPSESASPEGNVIRMESFADFLKAASS
ncbi:hypothetical protein SIID45300_01677 [Candidatus Magnetaquicoccaceae bacterium FCR-1]|uniref:HTH cro/C1-type domain-containing protein n=1 Tax=Candidatus Magnetaquiglobus chichijimensis TaxID=3141448 RepID=A0ABQ0C9H5_9PROT